MIMSQPSPRRWNPVCAPHQIRMPLAWPPMRLPCVCATARRETVQVARCPNYNPHAILIIQSKLYGRTRDWQSCGRRGQQLPSNMRHFTPIPLYKALHSLVSLPSYFLPSFFTPTMSLLPLSLLLLLSTFSAAAATHSSTLHLARSPGSHSAALTPGASVNAWAASLAAQSALDTSRVLTLAAAPGKGRSFVPIAPGRQILSIPNYVARASLGTPAQTLLIAIDPSNDAAWVPCSTCTGCAVAPSFSPTQSSTYQPVPCGSPQCSQVPNPSCPYGESSSCAFNLTYASSTFQAMLTQDSLALANDVVASYTFGCLQVVTGTSVPPQGLLGFGRGPLSFLSQTKDMYGSIFSYCLPNYKSSNFSGTLKLGPKGQPQKIKTTPLLYNPRRPSLYYVNMIGIRVGGKAVPVPASALAFDPATGGGTIVDAGTMFTRLAGPAYAAVRDAFRRRVGAPVAGPLGGFDTCYNVTITAPTITFVFAGPVTVTLPEENVMIHSSSGSMACLAMAAGPADGVNAALNVIASMQQQNHRVLFDIANGRVGFSRELCTA